MIYTYDGLYSVALCRINPDLVFVFGDNLIGKGKGGQAVIRDEPNAFGVPTKKVPSNAPEAFFTDGLFANIHIQTALQQIHAYDRDYVIPVLEDGKISLGCGLARLPETAPMAYAYLQNWLENQPTKPFEGNLPRTAPLCGRCKEPYNLAEVEWDYDKQSWVLKTGYPFCERCQ